MWEEGGRRAARARNPPPKLEAPRPRALVLANRFGATAPRNAIGNNYAPTTRLSVVLPSKGLDSALGRSTALVVLTDGKENVSRSQKEKDAARRDAERCLAVADRENKDIRVFHHRRTARRLLQRHPGPLI